MVYAPFRGALIHNCDRRIVEQLHDEFLKLSAVGEQVERGGERGRVCRWSGAVRAPYNTGHRG